MLISNMVYIDMLESSNRLWESPFPASPLSYRIKLHRNKCTLTVMAMSNFNHQYHHFYKMIEFVDVPSSFCHRMDELPSMKSLIQHMRFCRNQKDPAEASNVYLFICDYGLDINADLASYLIPMLVDCRRTPYAQNVFNRLRYQTEYCWTSLMQGYVELEEPEHALNLFRKMEEEDSVSLTTHTFTTCLKASTYLKSVEEGRTVHAKIVKVGLECETFIRSALVNLYTKTGFLEDAQKVFDDFEYNNVVLWTMLIAGYTDSGCDEKALSCLEEMLKEGIEPDNITLACGLRACSHIGALDIGRLLHAEITKDGLEKDSFISSALLEMYTECDLLAEAEDVFHDLPVRDIFAWGTLISAYEKQNMYAKVFSLEKQMREDVLCLDSFVITCILKACGNGGLVFRGQKMHDEVIQKGLDSCLVIGNSLIYMYMKCGLTTEAEKTFYKLQDQDISSWNALVMGYSEHMTGEQVLNLSEEMFLHGIPPNTLTYMFVLGSCHTIGDLKRGQSIHSSIVIVAFEGDPSIANSLINLYGDFGLLEDALYVFDQFPEKSAPIIWDAIIAVYANHGYDDMVYSCLEQMQNEGICPNYSAFIYALKDSYIWGRNVHLRVTKTGLDKETVICNSLIDMYGKCGLFMEAEKVFTDLCVKDVVSWTTLIAAYTDYEFGAEALNCLEDMEDNKISPNIVTYVCSLKASINARDLEKGLELHAQVIVKGFEKNLSISNSLLDIYATFGLLAEAKSLFNELVMQDTITWNSLIRGFVDHGFDEDAILHFENMKQLGIALNPVTYIFILKACNSLGDINKFREIHGMITKSGFDEHHFVANALLDIYTKHGSVEELEKVFYTLSNPDVISWTTLITGYNERGLFEKAINCMDLMKREGVQMNAATFVCGLHACCDAEIVQTMHAELLTYGFESEPFIKSALVDVYSKRGLFKEMLFLFDENDITSWNALINIYASESLTEAVMELLKELHVVGLLENIVTFLHSLKTCCKTGALEHGYSVHRQIVLRGLEQYEHVANSLIDMYAKCGLFLEAEEMFSTIVHKNINAWTTLMSSHIENDQYEKALGCLEQMKSYSISSNAVTFVLAMKACGYAKDIDRGKTVHQEIVIKGIDKDKVVCNASMNMYAKCGCMEEAKIIFEQLPMDDVMTWSGLVMGYKEQGLDDEILKCYETMCVNNVLPDAMLYSCFLKSFGYFKAIAEGQHIHVQVLKRGIDDTHVVNALIEMYARCGFFVEANAFFVSNSMLDADSWTTLISVYAENENCEEALMCMERMQAKEYLPNAITYISCLKACGELGVIHKGQTMLSQIIKVGLERDNFLWNGAIAEEQHICATYKTNTVDQMLGNACVDMYAKCGSMLDAQKMFDSMVERDLVTWNALITGYARKAQTKNALYFLHKMDDEGIQADGITFLSILNLCNHTGLVDESQKCFEAMVNEYHLVPDVGHINCLVDLLTRAGQLEEAIELSNKLDMQLDLAIRTTLLSGCRSGNNIDLARLAFEWTMESEENCPAQFVLMSNIYSEIL